MYIYIYTERERENHQKGETRMPNSLILALSGLRMHGLQALGLEGSAST